MAQTRSLKTNGSSQYGSIADNASLSFTGNFTIELWAFLDSLPASNDWTFAGKWANDSNQREYRVFLRHNGSIYQLCLATSTNGTAFVEGFVTWTSPVARRWYHLAFVKSGTTATIYVDGRVLGTATVDATHYNGTSAFSVGALLSPTAAQFFNGKIKDVRVFNDARTQSEIVSDAHSETVVDANLVAEYNFNGAATDSSGNGNNLTLTGSPVYSTEIPWEAVTSIQSAKKVLNILGSSAQKASISDGSQTGLDLSGDLTLEGWFCFRSLTASSGHYLISKFTSGQFAYRLLYNKGSGLYFSTSSDGSSTTGGYVSGTAGILDIGRWYHIAVSKTGTTASVYINGVLVGTVTVTSSVYNGTAAFELASQEDAAFDGQMKEVRVWNSARTQAQILSDAITATSISDSNLKGEWLLNDSYADTSGNSNTLTATNSPTFKQWSNRVAGGLVSYWSLDETSGNRADSHGSNTLTDNNTVTSSAGKQGNAANFVSGNSEFLQAPAGNDFGNAFTLGGWVKTTTSAERAVIERAGAVGTFTNLQSIRIQADGKVRFYFRDGSGGASSGLEGTAVLNDGNFHHIVCVNTGSIQAIYVDGKLDALSVVSTSDISLATAFFVGKSYDSSPTYISADIDELFIANRALGYGEILDLFKEGNAIPYAYSAPAAQQNSAFLAFMGA